MTGYELQRYRTSINCITNNSLSITKGICNADVHKSNQIIVRVRYFCTGYGSPKSESGSSTAASSSPATGTSSASTSGTTSSDSEKENKEKEAANYKTGLRLLFDMLDEGNWKNVDGVEPILLDEEPGLVGGEDHPGQQQEDGKAFDGRNRKKVVRLSCRGIFSAQHPIK